jgi:hypothetical protein
MKDIKACRTTPSHFQMKETRLFKLQTCVSVQHFQNNVISYKLLRVPPFQIDLKSSKNLKVQST